MSKEGKFLRSKFLFKFLSVFQYERKTFFRFPEQNSCFLNYLGDVVWIRAFVLLLFSQESGESFVGQSQRNPGIISTIKRKLLLVTGVETTS